MYTIPVVKVLFLFQTSVKIETIVFEDNSYWVVTMLGPLNLNGLPIFLNELSDFATKPGDDLSLNF